jgi:quercetin dioxygenase-like cupin family protein
MSEQPDRLRQHPEGRFYPPQHRIDLNDAAAKLLAEPLGAKRNHRQETLYKHGAITVALFVLERGASMPQHEAEGVVTVHVLDGRLRMSAEGQTHTLRAGQVLILAPGVRHDVDAEEPTRMLLTVCLETGK